MAYGYVECSACGKRVSNVIPDVDIVVHAWVECPECIVKQPVKEPGMVDGSEYDALQEAHDRATKKIMEMEAMPCKGCDKLKAELEKTRQMKFGELTESQLHDELAKQLSMNRSMFKQHSEYVSKFLTDMYSIMIDPLAEGEVKVIELCPALLDAAKRDRQTIYDLQNGILKMRDQIVTVIDRVVEILAFVAERTSDLESVQYLATVSREMAAAKKVLIDDKGNEGIATA